MNQQPDETCSPSKFGGKTTGRTGLHQLIGLQPVGLTPMLNIGTVDRSHGSFCRRLIQDYHPIDESRHCQARQTV
jgi:hypothetical protein